MKNEKVWECPNCGHPDNYIFRYTEEKAIEVQIIDGKIEVLPHHEVELTYDIKCVRCERSYYEKSCYDERIEAMEKRGMIKTMKLKFYEMLLKEEDSIK